MAKQQTDVSNSAQMMVQKEKAMLLLGYLSSSVMLCEIGEGGPQVDVAESISGDITRYANG